VAKYLQDVDKLQEVGKVQGEVPFHFSELDLSTYLTQEQLKSLDKNLAKFKPEQLMHKGYCEITQWDPCCCCFKYIESWC